MLSVMLASLVIGFSGAVAPGPMTAYVIGAAHERPLPAAALLVLGHGILEALVVAAIAFGVQTVPFLEGIALAGSAVLVFFGIQQFRSTGEVGGSLPLGHRPFVFGVTATLSNPYWWIWWLTFGAGFLALNPEPIPFYVGHIGADLVWYIALSLIVARSAGFLGVHYAKVVKASGIAMMLFGLYYALSIFWA
ncbi:MAG: LysE family transporter [Methanomicrobiales archaeon]|nr:LysE family transporter [Methanomicrobiales archaeon]MDI6875843.1 LysE family transporter [Methanomicrobiales archaeon]